MRIDQNYLTNGYPELAVSGGAGATVKISYAEALFPPGSARGRANRDEVEGRRFQGMSDIFLPDGAEGRLWSPLWWRTWRYVQLEIQTAAVPLRIDDFRGVFTGYPFVRKARFDAADPELAKIDHRWACRACTTARCAGQTPLQRIPFVPHSNIIHATSILRYAHARSSQREGLPCGSDPSPSGNGDGSGSRRERAPPTVSCP